MAKAKDAAEKSAGQGGLTPEAIEAWFVEFIHNSPISRDSEVYNHARKAVDELKKRAQQEK